MIPTNLRFAQMQQTNAARATANSPQILSSPAPFYGSDPNRLSRLREEGRQNLTSAQSLFNLRSSFEEYERQKKLQPEEDELKRLRMEQEKLFLPQLQRLSKLRLEQEEQELRSKMAFRPMMDELQMKNLQRMGATTRIAPSGPRATSGFGAMAGSPASPSTQFASPSWMQNYQTPQFPNY